MEPQNTDQNSLPQQPPTTPPTTYTQPPVSQPVQVLPPTPQEQPTMAQIQSSASSSPARLPTNVEKIKKITIQIMIGSLVGAAVIAVIAVLIGDFSDTFQKALGTLLLVMVHSLACLAFVEQNSKSKNSEFKFFENAVFFIIVLSFFTSIFGVWGIASGNLVGKLYGTYFILLFACLHGQMLVEARGKKSSIDTLVDVNYVIMGFVILLIFPLIWITDSNLPAFYYRLLAAFGIIDATLTILSVILYKMYVQKHPEIPSAIFSVSASPDANGNTVPLQVVEQKRHIHPLIWLLGIFIVGQVVVSILFGVLGAFYR